VPPGLRLGDGSGAIGADVAYDRLVGQPVVVGSASRTVLPPLVTGRPSFVARALFLGLHFATLSLPGAVRHAYMLRETEVNERGFPRRFAKHG
jgi:hypothetical protein